MSFPAAPRRPESADGADNAETIWHKLVHDILWDPKVNLFVESSDIKVDKTPKGYEIKLKNRPGDAGGTPVYIPVCLEDGTLAYAQIRVYGKIYALADGTGYVTPTVDPGSVPDNAKILE